MAAEKTGPQVLVTSTDGALPQPKPVATYKTYKKMREDPTIKLGRAMVIAPIVTSPWSIEAEPSAPEGAKGFIKAVMEPLRIHILKTAVCGHIDYGWSGYEKVFGLDPDGLIRLKKLKPLLQSMTDILVDPDTGAFAGLRQVHQVSSKEINLRVQESLCITVDMEGTNFYGEALLDGAVEPWTKYNTVEAAAARYDKKVAGTHWVVYYPIGTTPLNGTETDNFLIAKSILDAVESSGKMVVPREVQQRIEQMGDKESGWKIELLTDGSSGRAAFTERQKYLDSLKVRGLELPERSVLEGQFGTKAEAETHGDFAITNLELKHQVIVEQVNWHLVNQLLRLNWGPEAENSVWIHCSPIADGERAYLKSIYNMILTNPELGSEEIDAIDRSAMRDQVGIPTKQDQELSPENPYPIRLLDPDFKINMLPPGYNPT